MALFLLAILIASPLPTVEPTHTATAAIGPDDVTPPDTVVVTVVNTSRTPSGIMTAKLIVNWTLATNDPGSWNYDLYTENDIGQTRQTVGSCNPISTDPGANWCSFPTSISNGSLGEPSFQAWVVSIAPDGSHSGESCRASFNINHPRTIRDSRATHQGLGRGQCGDRWDAPSINRVTVSEELTSTSGGTTLSFFPVDDDPNATGSNNFTYQVRAQFISIQTQDDDGQATTVTAPVFSYVNPGACDNGFCNHTIQYAGTSPFYLGLDVRAIDYGTGTAGTATDLIGEFSCQTIVSPATLFDTNRCGLFVPNELPGWDVPTSPSEAEDLSQTPTFPMVDVADFGTSLNVTTTSAGFILGGGLVAVTTAYAASAFGAIAAAGAFGLGIGIATTLGLLPLWVSVVVFLAAATVATFTVKRGGTAA